LSGKGSLRKNGDRKSTPLKKDKIIVAEPVGPIPEPLPAQQTLKLVPNVPILSKQMHDQVLILADQLQRLLDDPSLAAQQQFLSEFIKNTSSLNQTVDQAILLR
jgi:hypothetical protein